MIIMYNIIGCSLFRNDGTTTANNIRPYYYPGYPYCSNGTGIEITVMRLFLTFHILVS